MKRTLVLLTLNEIEGVTALFDRIPFDAAAESLVAFGLAYFAIARALGLSEARTFMRHLWSR